MADVFSQGHALVIGVGGSLPATIPDAKAMARLLQDSGRCAYPESQVQLLTGEAATHDGILQALAHLADRVQPDSTAMVYFSGHGAKLDEAHLVPFEADAAYRANQPSADWQSHCISATELSEALARIQAKKLVVFLDCCYAAGQAVLEWRPESKSSDEPLPSDALERFAAGSGRVLLAASRREELAYAIGLHSVFTEALLEGFAGYGALPQDGWVRIFELTEYVLGTVRSRTHGEQNPILKADHLDENYTLGYYAGGELAPKQLSPGSPLPATTLTMRSEKELATLKTLETLRRDLRQTEVEIGRLPVTSPELKLKLRRRNRLEVQVSDLSGELGQLPQQTPAAKSLSQIWSTVGKFTFLLSVLVWSATQGGPTSGELQNHERYSVVMLGIVLGGVSLLVLYLFTLRYIQHVPGKDWATRLPVAFTPDIVFSASTIGRPYQGIFLLGFLIVPWCAQIHFLHRIYDGTSFGPDGWEASGLEHLTKWPNARDLFSDSYRLGAANGWTFFPGLMPWLFVLLFGVLTFYLGRVVGRLFGWDGWAERWLPQLRAAANGQGRPSVRSERPTP